LGIGPTWRLTPYRFRFNSLFFNDVLTGLMTGSFVLKQELDTMDKLHSLGVAAALGLVFCSPFAGSTLAQGGRPAFVIVERTATTGPEAIQQEYAKLAREILPKYAARYLARSQENTLLEGDGAAPCCMAVLEFPNMDAVRRWYDSPENREASKVRQSGAKFRIIAIQGLPLEMK
jgi:uncharacterized protein (DUF1330 family)